MTITATPHQLFTVVLSPVGRLLLSGDGQALTGLRFAGRDAPRGLRRDDARFAEEARQLAEYFAGERTGFDLALRLDGPAFDRRVWDALRRSSRHHHDLRRAGARIGAAGQAWAVGSANARNPVAIAVPCHRVIGANGRLTGYAGGLERKHAMLAHEGAILI